MERLALEKHVVPQEFELEDKLWNLCVKIPLLQVIRDIPIPSKTIRDLFIKKSGRKIKQPTIIQVGGQATTLITNYLKIGKYANPRNPIVTGYINNIPIPNTLIDQGVAINIMIFNTMEELLIDQGVAINIMIVNTMEELQLKDLWSTPTILESANRSKLKLEGIIDDVMVFLVSWEYPTDFMVIQPNLMEGHCMILGRPWLAIVDAYISCRKGEMIASNGLSTKKIILHPPTQLASAKALWVEYHYEHNLMEWPIVNVEQIRKLQEQTEENVLDQFISTGYYENLNDPNDLETFEKYHHIFSKGF